MERTIHKTTEGGSVRKTYIIGAAVVIACSSITLAGQEPAPTAAQQPAAQQKETQQAAGSTVTLTGCVYLEKDVPGRAPNVAERAGVLEDYILAEVSPAASQTPGTPGAVGTSGTAMAKMYKLELIEDEKLKAVVGKRIEVTGRIDAEAGDATSRAAAPPPTTPTDKAIGRDRVDLPEFEVASIKEVSGSCPAQPNVR